VRPARRVPCLPPTDRTSHVYLLPARRRLKSGRRRRIDLRRAPPRLNWPRGLVVAADLLAIFLPLFLIFYQSFLTAPFFMPDKMLGLDAFRFIFDDPTSGSPSRTACCWPPAWPRSRCRWAACSPS
jgi:hypothetical protein